MKRDFRLMKKGLMILFLLLSGLVMAERPVVKWGKIVGGLYDDLPLSVTSDNKGNSYVAGDFISPQISFDSIMLFQKGDLNAFLTKYDKYGKVLWANNINGKLSIISSICVDKDENVIASGYFIGSQIAIESITLTNDSNGKMGFIVKYNSDGKVLWAKTISGLKENFYMSSICSDNSGNIFLGGDFVQSSIIIYPITYTSPLSQNLYIHKMNQSGETLWRKTIQAKSGDQLRSITTDSIGNLYLTGDFIGSSISFGQITLDKSTTDSTSDIFVAKYNAFGDIQWAVSAKGNSTDISNSIATDGQGFLYIGGFSKSKSMTFGLINSDFAQNGYLKSFLAKYNIYGNPIWIKSFSTSSQNNIINSVNADKYGNVYSTGYFDGDSICLEKTVLKNIIPDTKELYLTKHDKQGNLKWAISVKGEKDEKGLSIFADNSGNCYVTGNTDSEICHIDTFNIKKSNHEYHDIFIAKFSNGIEIIGDSTICQNQPVTLKASGATSYFWSTNETNDSIIVNKPGYYWVIGYSQSGNPIDTIFITIKDITPKVSITGNPTYCPGHTTTLTAHGTPRYLWNNGSTNSTIEVGIDTTVWLVGYSESGCVSDTVRFKITQEPDWAFTLSGDTSFCKGESITLSASGAESYRWNTGTISDNIKVGTPGEYVVIGTNSRGCTKTLMINVIENTLPDVDFTLSKSSIDFIQSLIEAKIEPQSGVSYYWEWGDGFTDTGSSAHHTYNVSNDIKEFKITLTATSSQGCTNSFSRNIEVLMVVPNVFTPNGDGINDIFMPNVDLLIFDRNGVILYNGKSGWDGTYKGNQMPNDIYFYEIKYSDKNQKTQTLKGHVTLKK